MKLVKANEKDNQKLLNLFSSIPVDGAIEHILLRSNFFLKYKMQSDDSETFMMIDEKDTTNVHGVVTIIYKKAMIEDKIQTIGIALDLRISSDRRAKISWSKLIHDQFQISLKKRNCKYLFSLLEQTDSPAYNALVRPQPFRTKTAQYHLVKKVYFVGIYGKWPWGLKPVETIAISELNIKDHIDQIFDYIDHKRKLLKNYIHYTKQEFLDQVIQWQKLGLKNFIVAQDNKSKIIGCLAPWDFNHIQTIQALSYRGDLAKTYANLEWSKILFRTKFLPPSGEILNFWYLSHLYVNNADIFFNLLSFAYDKLPKDSFIFYPSYRDSPITRPPKSFVSSSIPYGVFRIISRDENQVQEEDSSKIFASHSFDNEFILM